MKLKYQWPFVWSLVFLLPFCDSLALPTVNGTLWQHLLWPLVHANILHWLINTICFMGMWRLISHSRLLWGYIASVAIGYIWSSDVYSSLFPLNHLLKLCGLSCIIFFLIGIIFVRARKWYRIRLTILIIISCFIPNIAAAVHIIALLFGILYSYCARSIGSRGSRYIIYNKTAGFIVTANSSFFILHSLLC